MESKPAELIGADFHHYLPIPDELFHTGIYVTSAGRKLVEPGNDYPPALHPPLYQFQWREGRILPEFSLILITAGGGTFESRPTGAVSVRTGMAILLFPGVWHRYRPDPATGWTEEWMHFNGEFAHLLQSRKIIEPEQAVLLPVNMQATASALDGLLKLIHREPSSNSLLLSLRALNVLTMVLGDAQTASGIRTVIAPKPPTDSIVTSAMDVIWTRNHQVLSVGDVVRATGVNRRTLERRTVAELGHGVLEEIVRCRFSRAERLLCETKLPIKTVVSLAGFGSGENMRQVFIARTGHSPAQYRRRKMK